MTMKTPKKLSLIYKMKLYFFASLLTPLWLSSASGIDICGKNGRLVEYGCKPCNLRSVISTLEQKVYARFYVNGYLDVSVILVIVKRKKVIVS